MGDSGKMKKMKTACFGGAFLGISHIIWEHVAFISH
jgi:hypothetical protein